MTTRPEREHPERLGRAPQHPRGADTACAAGTLPDKAEFTYRPEHVHEAAVLIDAIHALHTRAVNAERQAAELRELLDEAAPLIHSACVFSVRAPQANAPG